MFVSWLTANDHKIEVDIKSLAQDVAKLFEERVESHMGELCAAVNQLSDVFSSQHVRDLMEDFDNAHSANPYLRLWTSYMEMMELLIAMIRAERDGNWALHLETFAAMLPLLTIYDHTNYARWGPVYLADMKNLETKTQKFMLSSLKGTSYS